jgi:hypothetical protein
MATGIVSGAWGYSPKEVSGILNAAEFKNQPLSYQLGLNSRQPTFNSDGQMVSPLTIANEGFYNVTTFGKKRSNKNSEITYLKKQLKRK